MEFFPVGALGYRESYKPQQDSSDEKGPHLSGKGICSVPVSYKFLQRMGVRN